MIEINEVNGVICAKGSTGPKRGNMEVYVFFTDGMLVDTGPQSLLSEYIPFFEAHDIEKVVLTHYHEDHTGGAKWLQDYKQVPAYIHPLSVNICTYDGVYPHYRKSVWGHREGFAPQPLDYTFQSRTTNWEAIYTPGHADDHLVFLNPQTGTLFSGDLFVTARPKLMLREESVPVTIRSLKMILTYDFSDVFCCHQGYLKNGKEKFRQKLNYLENLRGEILHLHTEGRTIAEIQAKLLPIQAPIIEFSNHEWDSAHMITSVLND